ncbi:MAG: phage tail assembly protein T, partial [Plesiomonas shigelloides]
GWMAYSSIEPFGEYRSELRNGNLMSLIANIKRDTAKKREPCTPADFMNFLREEKEDTSQPTPEEIEAKLAQIFG